MNKYIYEYLKALGLRFSLPENFDAALFCSQVNLQRLSNNPVLIDEHTKEKLIENLLKK